LPEDQLKADSFLLAGNELGRRGRNDATDPDVVYLEERSDMSRYTLAFGRLRAAALHPDDSVQMIERLAEE
jgi:hypothetical protein